MDMREVPKVANKARAALILMAQLCGFSDWAGGFQFIAAAIAAKLLSGL
jgi:hypothetical protein